MKGRQETVMLRCVPSSVAVNCLKEKPYYTSTNQSRGLFGVALKSLEQFSYADFTRHSRLSERGGRMEWIEICLEKKERAYTEATGKNSTVGCTHGTVKSRS